MSLRTCLMMLLAGVVGAGCPLRKDAVAPGDGGLDRPDTGTINVVTPPDRPSDSKATGGNGNTSTGGDTAAGGREGLSGSGGVSGTATGGTGALGSGPGSGGSGESGGGAGSIVVVPDCVAGSTRLCKDDPGLRALGNCGGGQEACVAGHWGPCSVLPAAKDGCTLVGDDASCNGLPNEACPCVDGATQPCGPAADRGVCKRGTQTCAGAAWGTCNGAVYAAARDCTSAADNDCDGTPDNALDAVCVCAGATMRPCSEHVGKDGTGRCKAGAQSCVVSTDKKTSVWGACTGSVDPAAADTCDPGNDDNCNGVPNEGCGCVTGATQACGPSANVGICKRGTQTCTAGAWGACVGAIQATARDCTSPADNNCDGLPDNTVDAVCGCASGATQACNQHAGKDGNGPCKAGSQSCVVAADKKSSAWGACTGAVGPAAADTCDATNDDNCNGIPHDSCTCVNGTTRACGPTATGICKPGTQTCTNATWSTTCVGGVTAQPRDCTSSIDNDCNGTLDNLDSSCVCPANTSGPCPGNNTSPCKSGTRTCVLAANKGSTSWSTTCVGAILPAAADTCDPGNDANCSGKANDGCQCVNGSPPVACPCGTQSCSNGKLGACVTTCSGATPVCVNGTCGCSSDANCAGTNRPSCDPSTHKCVCQRKSVGNILQNPGFDTMAQTSGIWIDSDTVLGTTWTPLEDADGCPESGSIFGSVQLTSPCVPVSAGGNYRFGVKYKNASSADPKETCYFVVYTDPSCPLNGSIGFSMSSPPLSLPPSTSWNSASSSMLVPANFIAGAVSCNYGASGGPSTGVNSYIDQVYLNASANSF